MTRENTVNVPREPDSGLLSVIASMVRRIAVPTSIDPDEVYFDNGHARQIYKAITDAAPLHEGEGEPVAWLRDYHLGHDDNPCLGLAQPGDANAFPVYAAPPPSVEVERLREALRDIDACSRHSFGFSDYSMRRRCGQIARAALSQEPGVPTPGGEGE